ncbi:MAG: Stf0 family sulfotransferase [Acidimicrobiales bacterium]
MAGTTSTAGLATSFGPDTATVPTSSYMICATPRTGSYVLCEGLRHTGVAGNPNEYLSGGFQRYWAPRWGTARYPAYLRRVTRLGTTPNGVFGVKVHPVQFNHFLRQASGTSDVPLAQRREILEQWLPGARYVWLRRGDRLRQAISYTKSIQTKIWWDADQPPSPYDAPQPDALRFDRDLIAQSLAQMEAEDASWAAYFDAHGIEPLVLSYEELVGDVDAAVRAVTDHIGVDLAPDFKVPPTQFRRQADSTTEDWLARFSGEQAHVVPGTRSHPELVTQLGNRRWWRCATPFPHFRADRVFVDDLYERMAAQFREHLAAGLFARDIPGYDASAKAVTAKDAGDFSVFVSSAWRDLLAGLMAPDATGEVNLTLHHHDVGSRSGLPHNDLNPGWFAAGDDPGAITVSDAAVCPYRTGVTTDERHSVERVRAVAVIFYLANPPDAGNSHGGTGLYRQVSDPVHRPVALIPPSNNSLVAFECTPYSFHSFITNPYFERNCLVMWLHRRKEDVVRRWGEQSIVGW